MLLEDFRLRSLPLLALGSLASAAQAQNCTGTIQGNLSQISISTGGTQVLDLSVAPGQADMVWQLIGAYGTSQPTPWFANGGLLVNNDRYLYRMYTGHAGFVQGGITGYIGGPVVPFDVTGHAQLGVVIPQGLPSTFIGKTLHHGMYRTSALTLMPECGTPTVSLTLVP